MSSALSGAVALRICSMRPGARDSRTLKALMPDWRLLTE